MFSSKIVFDKISDPLEQFATLILFPGCPVNNWDSFRWVPIIGIVFITFLFISANVSFIKIFSNNYSFVKKYDSFNLDRNIFVSYVVGNFLTKKICLDNFKITLNFLKMHAIKDYSNNFINLIINKSFFFIYTLIKENLQTTFYMFFPIYFFSFIVILLLNLLGLLPYSITATSSFIFILNYSFGILVGLNILGIYLYCSKYFNQFLPEGVPLFIAPVLVVIELFSNVIRIFSLTVRLFANILAGHSLLKIMIAVSWYCISLFFYFVPLALIVWFVLVPIFLLEVIIAFLQAYVYVLLLIIYTNDIINVH